MRKTGLSVALGDGLTATPLLVPHRGEYTDTLGWYLAGSRKRALYIPDTDPWAKWEADIEAVLDGVDLLMVDGTFYSGDELPGRDLTQLDPASPQRRALEQRGFVIAQVGREYGL